MKKEENSYSYDRYMTEEVSNYYSDNNIEEEGNSDDDIKDIF